MKRPDKNDIPDVPETIASLIERLEGHPDAFAASSLGSWLALCYGLAGRYGFCQVWLSKIEGDNQLVPMTGTGVLPVDGCSGACLRTSADDGEAANYIISRDFGENDLYRLWRHPCPRCRGSNNGAVFTSRLDLGGKAFALSFHGPARLRRPAPALVAELVAIVRHLQLVLRPQPMVPSEALKKALRNSPVPVFLANDERRIVWTNLALHAMGHYGEQELVGRGIEELTGADEQVLGLEHAGGQLQPIFVLQALTPLLDRRGGVEAYLGIVRGRDDADVAPETALASGGSIGFDERLPLALHETSRKGVPATVLLLDLDRFQQINERYGEAVGDRVLVAVGERLRQCLRGFDLVSRRREDEFAILATGIAEDTAVPIILARVQEAFAVPFQTEGRDVSVSASIGIANFPRDARCADSLMRCAETAMYAAKIAGSGFQQFGLLETDRVCAI